MSIETLEQTEMRISPELKTFGGLVREVNYFLKYINKNAPTNKFIKTGYVLARRAITNFESQIITDISFDRQIAYGLLLDNLRERIEEKYLEAQR